jgi:hypothetical protein
MKKTFALFFHLALPGEQEKPVANSPDFAEHAAFMDTPLDDGIVMPGSLNSITCVSLKRVAITANKCPDFACGMVVFILRRFNTC